MPANESRIGYLVDLALYLWMLVAPPLFILGVFVYGSYVLYIVLVR